MCKKHWNFAMIGLNSKRNLLIGVCSLVAAAVAALPLFIPEEMTVSEPERSRIAEAYGKLPIRFETNEGQADSRVQYTARGGGYNLFLTSNEAVLVVRSQDAAPAVLSTRLVNSKSSPEISAGSELPGRSHYFVGNDRREWRTNVKSYDSVRYASVYEGVDLVYHGNQQQLEYDFVVSPGADPHQIQMTFEGAERIEIDDAGDLILRIGDGEVRQKRPYAYQDVDGIRTQVAADFSLAGGGKSVSFELGDYDHNRPLVIDPVLVYSTYLGGISTNEFGLGIAVDSEGNAFVAGYTPSFNFPLQNPYQDTRKGGLDAFVTKLNPSGSALVYSTFLGGDGTDQARGIAVDSDGNAYVTGLTISTDFPLQNAYQDVMAGLFDAFITKLSPTGSELIYSTYLGGSSREEVRGIDVDSAQNAYVTGFTLSSNFPVKNAYQGALQGGLDVFVTKVNPSGSDLAYSTYLGGSGDDEAAGIAVDSEQNVYVTGYTRSSGFPLRNAYQNGMSGGQDVFITKMDSSGSALVYSTYLGGTSGDWGSGIAVDSAQNVYVTGYTLSSNFPLQNPYRNTNRGVYDAFVTKLNSSGSALIYSTYLGGTGFFDWAQGIAVDSNGNAYVTGYTDSLDFPVLDPHQSAPAGESEAFITKLNPLGSALFSTYMGGTSPDFSFAIAVDSQQNVYVTGHTASSNFPFTSGAFRTARSGSTDAFVAKFATFTNTPAGQDVPVTPVHPDTGEAAPATLTFESVTQPGLTTLSTSSDGPDAPEGFSIGDPPVYYDIATTAVFEGAITVCITHPGLRELDQLMHYDGVWIDVTTSVSVSEGIICGEVFSLSPFVVASPSDTMPPVVEAITPTPAFLWPPDHRMVQVSLNVSATDNLDPNPVCSLTGITSSEAVDGLGDGDTSPDWEVLGGFSMNLRAERAASGPGRTYAVSIQCTDGAGNRSTATTTVTVPANQGRGNR